MAKLLVVFCLILGVCYVCGLDLSCPLSSQMTSCSPKCKEDYECSGRKCCPNICNMKSCVPANMKLDRNDGYKNQNSKTATGSYCGNVKCSSFEKCKLDPATKRERCMRN